MQIFTEEKSKRKWDRNISFFKSSYYNNHIKYHIDISPYVYFTYFCIWRAFYEFSINARIYIYTHVVYINEITNFVLWQVKFVSDKTDRAVKISRVYREKQSFVNCHRDRWCKSSFKRGAKSTSRPRKRRNKK